MKAGGGKQKGAGFERLVCKQLSLWITNGEKPDVFWRSAMSGGRSTVFAKKGREASTQAGDITATGAEGHLLADLFFMECKFYRDLSLLSFIFGHQRGKLHEFWRVAREQAHKHKKQPMLIAKQNLEQTIVLLQYSVDQAFQVPKLALKPVDPIAYIITEEVYIYWFNDLFPLPKPRLPNARPPRQ